ncbi:unnamed protein product, partial [Amoebophrya sp. A25]|eukprot:GSA25T00008823001.1
MQSLKLLSLAGLVPWPDHLWFYDASEAVEQFNDSCCTLNHGHDDATTSGRGLSRARSCSSSRERTLPHQQTAVSVGTRNTSSLLMPPTTPRRRRSSPPGSSPQRSSPIIFASAMRYMSLQNCSRFLLEEDLASMHSSLQYLKERLYQFRLFDDWHLPPSSGDRGLVGPQGGESTTKTNETTSIATTTVERVGENAQQSSTSAENKSSHNLGRKDTFSIDDLYRSGPQMTVVPENFDRWRFRDLFNKNFSSPNLLFNLDLRNHLVPLKKLQKELPIFALPQIPLAGSGGSSGGGVVGSNDGEEGGSKYCFVFSVCLTLIEPYSNPR